MKVCGYDDCSKEIPKDRKYCSISCGTRSRPKKEKKLHTLICLFEGCQQTFLADRKNRKFCNHSCAAKHNNLGVVRNGKPSNPCLRKTCDNKVIVSRNSLGYCSTACRQEDEIAKYLAGELNGNWKYTYAAYVLRYLRSRAEDACEECGFDKKREDGSIILEVDHIDGNWQNNRPHNVRLLCPNCHRLTPNWGAKNMGNGRSWKREYSQFESKQNMIE